MKMKEVCERTGLTDRAVRYYIEEGLLAPECSENYLGRKSFRFSGQDVSALKEILVLRNTGFSVAEIAAMQQDPDEIGTRIAALSERTAADHKKSGAVLDALSRLDVSRIRSVSDLADALTAKEPLGQPAPAEDRKTRMQLALAVVKTVVIALLTWLPFVIAAFGVIMACRTLLYPVFESRAVLFLLLLLLPSTLVLFLPKLFRSEKGKRCVRTALLILCALCIPLLQFWSLFAVDTSETHNLYAYRRFDANCQANYDGAFQAFFPMETMFLNGKQYSYRYEETVFGASTDVFAERRLEEAEFAAETERVGALFAADERWDGAALYTYRQGSYTCLLRYRGEPPVPDAQETDCVSDDVYYLFACDAATNTVRYFYFNSEIGGVASSRYNTMQWETEHG